MIDGLVGTINGVGHFQHGLEVVDVAVAVLEDKLRLVGVAALLISHVEVIIFVVGG